jgi:uncharacterized membrane protein
MTNGSYYFSYVAQVTIEEQNAFAVGVFWLCVLVISLVTSPLMEGMGVIGAFGLFGIISLLGGVYFFTQMKETEGLTSGQARQVFYPN